MIIMPLRQQADNRTHKDDKDLREQRLLGRKNIFAQIKTGTDRAILRLNELQETITRAADVVK